MLENDPEYQKIDRESAVAISVLADIDVQIPDEKEVNMCTAVKEWREELLEEGRNKGIIEGRDVGRKEALQASLWVENAIFSSNYTALG